MDELKVDIPWRQSLSKREKDAFCCGYRAAKEKAIQKAQTAKNDSKAKEEIQSDTDAANLPLLARNVAIIRCVFPEDSQIKRLQAIISTSDAVRLFQDHAVRGALTKMRFLAAVGAAGASEELGLSVWEAAKADIDKMKKDEWCSYFQPHCQCRSPREGRIRNAPSSTAPIVQKVPPFALVPCCAPYTPEMGSGALWERVFVLHGSGDTGWVCSEEFQEVWHFMMQMDQDKAVQEAAVLSTSQAELQVKLEDEASSTAQLYLAEIDNDLGVVHAEQVEAGDDEHNGKRKRKRTASASGQSEYNKAVALQCRGRVPKDTSGRVLSGPRVDSVAAEIKKLQSPDWASRHLISKTAFIRLTKSIVQEILQERYAGDKRPDVKFTTDALMLLQEAAEWKATDHMAAANKVAHHGRRVTLKPSDFKLLTWLKEHGT
eukprot:s398_g4.t1